jgi:hypothetical protein
VLCHKKTKKRGARGCSRLHMNHTSTAGPHLSVSSLRRLRATFRARPLPLFRGRRLIFRVFLLFLPSGARPVIFGGAAFPCRLLAVHSVVVIDGIVWSLLWKESTLPNVLRKNEHRQNVQANPHPHSNPILSPSPFLHPNPILNPNAYTCPSRPAHSLVRP